MPTKEEVAQKLQQRIMLNEAYWEQFYYKRILLFESPEKTEEGPRYAGVPFKDHTDLMHYVERVQGGFWVLDRAERPCSEEMWVRDMLYHYEQVKSEPTREKPEAPNWLRLDEETLIIHSKNVKSYNSMLWALLVGDRRDDIDFFLPCE